MADIHERILHTLFAEKETTNWVNLFERIPDVDKQLIRAKAKELADKDHKFIEIKSRITMPYTYRLGDPVQTEELKQIREKEKWVYDNQFMAKILYKGITEWMRISGSKQVVKRRISRAEWIGIIIGIVTIVLTIIGFLV